MPFKKLSAAIHGLYSSKGTISGNSNKTFMQLNHPGRQTSNFIGGCGTFKAPSRLAPSVVRHQLAFMPNAIHALISRTLKPMSHANILKWSKILSKAQKWHICQVLTEFSYTSHMDVSYIISSVTQHVDLWTDVDLLAHQWKQITTLSPSIAVKF